MVPLIPGLVRALTLSPMREFRDAFSHLQPRAIQNDQADADHGARSATPTKSQPSADIGSDDGMRLNKAIAATGLCSRRKADELILAGRVSVDGKQAHPRRHGYCPLKAVPWMAACCRPDPYTYLMLNKPVHVVCTVSDRRQAHGAGLRQPNTRRSRLQLSCWAAGSWLFFTEVAAALTNDGTLAQRLTHPRHHQPKTYEVVVRGTARRRALKTMRRGMHLSEGEDIMPVDVTAQPVGGNTLLCKWCCAGEAGLQIRPIKTIWD